MEGKLYDVSLNVAEAQEERVLELAAYTHLSEDSKLLKVLSSLDKDKVDEQIFDISEDIHILFSKKLSSSWYGPRDVSTKIFHALNSEVFIRNIHTLEDFRKYADAIMEVIDSCLQKDNDDTVVGGHEHIARNLDKIVADMVRLVRDDFDRDLDALVQIAHSDLSPDQKIHIFRVLQGIDGLIKTSDDLERFSQFISKLAHHNIDAKEILFNPTAENGGYFARTLFGWSYEEKGDISHAAKEEIERYAMWRSIITDSEQLDKALSVMELELIYGPNKNCFVNNINLHIKLTDKKEQFIDFLYRFAAKDILPGFVMDNTALLRNYDLSKEGLDVLPPGDVRKKWLKYCANALSANLQGIDKFSRFFNEGLSANVITINEKRIDITNIKGLSARELEEWQDAVDEDFNKAEEIIQPDAQLQTYARDLLRTLVEGLFESIGGFYGNKGIDGLKKLHNAIKGSADIFAVVDQAEQKKLTYDGLTRLVPLLGDADVSTLFPQTLKKAKEMLPKKIAFDEDAADYFIENLPKYYTGPWVSACVHSAINHYSVAAKLVHSFSYEDPVWKDEPWAQDVVAEAEKVIKEWVETSYEEDVSDGKGEGFSHEDKFRNHPLRKIQSSLGLGRVIAGKSLPEDVGLSLSKESIEAVREINEILKSEHQAFLEEFNASANVSEEDKMALMNHRESKVKMNNLLPNVQNFIGRYLAQMAEGDLQRVDYVIDKYKDTIKDIVREGYRLYLEVYNIDIPLYDKLYREFDSWRENGRYPMEVYLGRDGIYAYIGRRAQDAARRAKTGKEGRESLRAHGEIIEINPKYIVYPRYFRDFIKYEVKRAFLEQERITPDMDPLFYDTGYTGTIPEQIMRVMDFDDEDIEERIRLLSANRANRRIRGVSENARDDIVEYIEGNAKLEESASGLLLDRETGKIRHIAKPTTPREQFNFAMIKQAIARHYMVQEKIHFTVPDNNAYYDAENYRMRIRQKYAKEIPSSFIKSPQEYIEKHRTNHDGDKQPNGEYVTLTLNNGVEIVARCIESKPSIMVRQEYAEIRAAQKAGLPVPDPVGFLSGKGDVQEDYLLIKKVDGCPGRDFEKLLRKKQQLSDEKIFEIMTDVRIKLEDLSIAFYNQLNVNRVWRIEDVVIQFNEDAEMVEKIIPVRWAHLEKRGQSNL